MRKLLLILLASTSLLFTHCKKDDNKKDESGLISITGNLDVIKKNVLTSETRVLISWAGTDETSEYIFGEGTIDIKNNTFKIILKDSLPVQAFYQEGFGIGHIFLTNDKTIELKQYPKGIDYTKIIGAAGVYTVIFKKKDTLPIDSNLKWSNKFKTGYTIGKGYDIPDAIFDGYLPDNSNSVKITVDELNNIIFTNWS
jgi:hypothetical protein